MRGPAIGGETIEQIGGVHGKAILAELVPIGLRHCAAAVADAVVTPARPVRALIVRGCMTLGFMLDDFEVWVHRVPRVTQQEEFGTIGDGDQRVVWNLHDATNAPRADRLRLRTVGETTMRTILAAMAGALLAAGAMAQPAAPPIPSLAPGEVLLEVDGVGEAPAAADAVLIGIATGRGSTLTQAIAAARANGARAVAALRAAGIAAADVRAQLSLSNVGGFVGNAAIEDDGEQPQASVTRVNPPALPGLGRLAGTKTASVAIVLRVRDPARLDAVTETLAASGVDWIVGPGFEARPGPATIAEARTRAIAAARAQAEAGAAATGMRIARVLRISERAAASLNPWIEQLENAGTGWTLYAAQAGLAGGVDGPRARVRIAVDYALVQSRLGRVRGRGHSPASCMTFARSAPIRPPSMPRSPVEGPRPRRHVCSRSTPNSARR